MQVMYVAALGIVLGLAIGAILPFAVEVFRGRRDSRPRRITRSILRLW